MWLNGQYLLPTFAPEKSVRIVSSPARVSAGNSCVRWARGRNWTVADRALRVQRFLGGLSRGGGLRPLSETCSLNALSNSQAGDQRAATSGSRIFLMDASGILHRDHRSKKRKPKKNQAGEDTTLLHGFVVQFLRLMELTPHPTHCVVVFDFNKKRSRESSDDNRRKKTKQNKGNRMQSNRRHQRSSGNVTPLQERFNRYPEYKKKKDKVPIQIIEAIPQVRELLQKMGVQSASVEGWEADDVIGSLAIRAAAQGMHVTVVSRDKDFFQLLSPRINILRGPMKGGELFTESTFKEKYGIEPRQWVDVVALMGDKSDNIPGFEGIGSSTACSLIKTFGDIEGVLANAAQVKQPEARKVLSSEDGQKDARRNKELVIINKTLDIAELGFQLEDCRLMPPKDDGKSAQNAFRMNNLNSQTKRLLECLERWSRN